MAKVCEQTERFDDMLGYMRSAITEHTPELSVIERNLLSVAYKNSVGNRRNAWRSLLAVEGRDEAKTHAGLLKEYKAKIEKELDTICNEIIGFLDSKLLPAVKNMKGDEKEKIQNEVFFLKMKADYFRYIAEYSGEANKTAADQSGEIYAKALELAESHLETTDPIRLGLSLNASVFFYEVLNDSRRACDLAKKTFDKAIENIEAIDENNYKDSTTIMQLIRDNMNLWNAELEEKQADA